MRSDSKLWEICLEIYREMYKQSIPKANFDKLMTSGEAYKDGFFLKYYLDSDIQDKILKRICNKHKCNAMERKKISVTVTLGCAPNTSLERYKTEIKKSGRSKTNETKKRVRKQ